MKGILKIPTFTSQYQECDKASTGRLITFQTRNFPEPEMSKKSRAPTPPFGGASRSSMTKKTQASPASVAESFELYMSTNMPPPPRPIARASQPETSERIERPHPPNKETSGLDMNVKMQPGGFQAAATSQSERSKQSQRPGPPVA